MYICVTMVNQIENKKPLPVLIHLAAWGILLGLPFFFTGREVERLTVESYIHFVIVPLSFMLVFYMNYFFLVGRYLFSRHPKHFLISNLLLIAATMMMVHIIMHLLPEPPHIHIRPKREWQEIAAFFAGNFLLYMLVAGLSVAIKMTGGWYEIEAMRKELDKNRIETELKNLKSQLNPHFLFNTLNNIYSLIAVSPEKAQNAVHDLSRLLRYVLYESSQSHVPLGKEMDFINNYVELMRIRLPQHVSLKTSITLTNPQSRIAPLLFISLIENAFKHGVSSQFPSFIHLTIEQDDRQVCCKIENSYFPKNEQDRSGSGIGLTNLQKQLELLYPGNYQFIQEQKDGTFFSSLSITINTSET